MKKRRISLKKRTFNNIMPLLAVSVILAGFCMAPMKVYAFDTGDLSVKGMSAYGMARKHGDAVAMEYIKECNTLHPGAIPPEDLEFIIDQGYLSGYVDELKALGYISAGYTGGGSSTPAQTENTEQASAPEPAAFTVEDMEDTPMWATQVVNYRDGASTEYNKIGNLEQDEQVIVNGVASTGWYRFIMSDGSTAYVSNSYLTTEDPSNRELNTYNETDQVDTNVFEDTEPKVVDELIVSKEEYEEKETAVVEPAPEPEPEEVIAAEEKPEINEEVIVEEDSSAYSWKFYVSCIFAVVCVIIIGIGIYNVVRNKKDGNWK